MRAAPTTAVAVLIPAYLLLGTLSVAHVPTDFALLSGTLFLIGLSSVLRGRSERLVLLRAALYAACAFVVYLSME